MSQELYKELFYIDQSSPSGLRNRVSRGSRQKQDQPSGWLNKARKSYQIKINNTTTYVHRVIWTMQYGDIPQGLYIDHVDGNSMNNELSNLRLATPTQNCQNAAVYTKGSGLPKGVSKLRGSFQQNIGLGGKQKYLGLFNTPEEQSQAYENQAREHFGEFYREVKD